MSGFIINFENSSDYAWDLRAIVNEHTKVNTMLNTTVDDYKFNDFPIEDEPKQDIATDVSYASSSVTVPKRRRNKHKKTLVQEAKEDRVLSDKWNWRKYGEKAIKGSPYPRSYYRCSNSGKKQVEQSYTNPGKFLITYIDEHNHSYPSRRPSQAGRSCRGFRALPKLHTPTETKDMSSIMTRTTTPSSITEDKSILFHCDHDDDNVNVGCVGHDQSAYDPNNRGFEDDDFFQGLEYLDGLEMDLTSHSNSYCYQFPFPFPSNAV